MPNATSSPYAARLERALKSTNPPIGVRTLAKDLRPNGVESMRRLLRRFLNGDRTPGPQVAGEIVAALRARGVDTGELEQDEEEDLQALYRDLADAAATLDVLMQKMRRRMKGAA